MKTYKGFAYYTNEEGEIRFTSTSEPSSLLIQIAEHSPDIKVTGSDYPTFTATDEDYFKEFINNYLRIWN